MIAALHGILDSGGANLRQYASFNGVNSMVDANTGTALASLSEATLEFWMYATQYRSMMSIRAGGSEFLIHFGNWGAGLTNESVTIRTPNGFIAGVTDEPPAVYMNKWLHVAIVLTASEWKCYFDGVEKPLTFEATFPATRGTWSSFQAGSNVFSIGRRAINNTVFYQGGLDNVRIWNYARTQAQIAGSMNSAITSPQAGLIANYLMDGNMNDASGNNLHGTASNVTFISEPFS